MSDVLCVVCGEPWDFYGYRNGDMVSWEKELFELGAGCPSCEGEKNEHEFNPQSMDDIEFGDEDPMIRLCQYENVINGNKPEWKEPDQIVLWTCAGCGVQAITTPDQIDKEEYEKSGKVVWKSSNPNPDYKIPRNSKASNWYSSHPFWRSSPDKEPAHSFAEDIHVCEFCLDHCHRCGTEISNTVEWGDVYDPGYCNKIEGYGDYLYCTNCYEEYRCEECGNFEEDCYCEYEDE